MKGERGSRRGRARTGRAHRLLLHHPLLSSSTSQSPSSCCPLAPPPCTLHNKRSPRRTTASSASSSRPPRAATARGASWRSTRAATLRFTVRGRRLRLLLFLFVACCRPPRRLRAAAHLARTRHELPCCPPRARSPSRPPVCAANRQLIAPLRLSASHTPTLFGLPASHHLAGLSLLAALRAVPFCGLNFIEGLAGLDSKTPDPLKDDVHNWCAPTYSCVLPPFVLLCLSAVLEQALGGG